MNEHEGAILQAFSTATALLFASVADLGGPTLEETSDRFARIADEIPEGPLKAIYEGFAHALRARQPPTFSVIDGDKT